MQTFLPFADFQRSAAALDDRRLFRQRQEVLHILRIISRGDHGSWSSHPAVAQWRGHEAALLDYALTMCNEWNCRREAVPDQTHAELLAMVQLYGPSYYGSHRRRSDPPWLGLEAYHSNHRSRLKQKKSAFYPDEWTAAEPEAPGNLWPVTDGHGNWVYMMNGKVVAKMAEAPVRRLRPAEAVQCGWCNFWHNPEELKEAEALAGILLCGRCESHMDEILLIGELRAAGGEEGTAAAEELREALAEELRLARLGLL